MRNLVIAAAIAGLAAITVNCSGPQGSNSASDMLPSITTPSVLEAKGGNGNGKGNISPVPPASLTLVMVADDNADGPNWGDSVRFDVSTDATSDPRVSLTCSQDGDVVLGAQTPTPWPWMLATNSWQGGAADCTARLYYIDVTKTIELKSISFTVAE